MEIDTKNIENVTHQPTGASDEICNFKLRAMMTAIYEEQNKVLEVLHASTVEQFNNTIREGRTRQVVNVSEALQEKNISEVASLIKQRGSRVVLIAGPSSSGKTTFSRRLSIQLMACGLEPFTISLDDYYKDKEFYPLDEHGEKDYESLYALNLELLNNQLQSLFRGEEVEIPRFDFTQGKSILRSGNFLQLHEGQVLILEGIHGLNPELTADVPARDKFGIYVAPLTSLLGVDGHHINVVDKRLMRRIIRDYKYRKTNAQETIHRWASVRAGEEKWIAPYQGYADAMVNTSLIFELPAIKEQAVAALSEVPQDSPERAVADRLLAILAPLEPMTDLEIPPTSLLREFLGGSSFDV